MRLTIQNLSSDPADGWVTFGLPGGSLGCERISLPPRSGVVSMQYEPNRDRGQFVASEWVRDKIAALMPRFRCGPHESDPIKLDGWNQPTREMPIARVAWTTQIPGIPMHIWGWATIGSGSDIVEFSIRASCGSTTTPGQFYDLPALQMIVGEFPHIDLQVQRSLRTPSPEAMPDGSIRWTADIAEAQVWHRCASRIIRGALLCLPTNVALASGHPRAVAMRWRRTAPLIARVAPEEWAPEAWAGRWGAFDIMPTPPPAAYQETEKARRWNSFVTRLRTAGHDLDQDPHVQPIAAGQTGAQPDFGACRADLLYAEPWHLWDLLEDVDSEALRPVANREPDGTRALLSNHPRVQMVNRVPHPAHSRGDMLGWDGVGWIPSPHRSVEDAQHRSSLALCGMYQLTKDPALGSLILDEIECDRMGLGRDAPLPTIGSGTGSPRGVGRTLIENCHRVAADFVQCLPMVHAAIRHAHQTAVWRLSPASPVRPMWLNPAGVKYGWLDETNQPIMGETSWEPAIACAAFYAATLAEPGEPIFSMARELAIVAAENCVANHWFLDGATWRLCYAVRWHGPDTPLTPEQYRDPLHANVGGVSIHWVLPALQILLEMAPQSPQAARARAILAQQPQEPRTWEEANWRGVTRLGQVAP